jgi:hypothetical protein
MAIKVPVIISYNDKGAKQATKGVSKLGKSFKSLGLSSKLGYAAAAAGAAAFAKQSLATAMADEKAQATLARTLKNVGESFATSSVTKYIDGLQRATGVSEDQLRPAFGKLVTATQSASKAQDLLALSLDVSAATGKSAESVSSALSRAYLGNNTALGKLGTGLTKAQLKSMSFEQITKQLSTLFAGQASTAAATFSGQVDILKVAAGEASETIGYALIDSIKKLGGQNGAKDLAAQMEKLAQSTADVIAGVTIVIEYFKKLGDAMPSWLKTTLELLERFSPLGQAKEALAALELLGKKQRELAERAALSDRGNIMRGAVIADKAAKKLLEANKKITGEKKKQSALDKLKAIFDMDLIQLTAAKQGKLSAEELARVNALIAIKTEGKTDDIKALDELEALRKKYADAEIARQDAILATHKKNAAEILAISKASATDYANVVQPLLSSLGQIRQGATPGGLPGAGVTSTANPVSNAFTGYQPPTGSIFSPGGLGLGDLSYLNFDLASLGAANAQQAAALNVTVNMQGGINIGSQYEFEQSVQAAVQAANISGNGLTRAGL